MGLRDRKYGGGCGPTKRSPKVPTEAWVPYPPTPAGSSLRTGTESSPSFLTLSPSSLPCSVLWEVLPWV